MELTDSLKALFIDTSKALKGSARRLFMARTVQELGPGGQRRAERELGWNRITMRNSTVASGVSKPLLRGGASGPTCTCPRSWRTSAPSLIVRVRPIRSSVRDGCIRA